MKEQVVHSEVRSSKGGRYALSSPSFHIHNAKSDAINRNLDGETGARPASGPGGTICDQFIRECSALFVPFYFLPVSPMRSFLKNNGLTVALASLFLLSLFGMIVSGYSNYNEELTRHDQVQISLLQFLVSGEFLSALFENWESEFLQMGVYVVLTAWLFQRGSAKSKDPDEKDGQSESGARTSFFYAHSLGIVLFSMFIVSFILHAFASFRAAAAEAIQHDESAENILSYLMDAEFWFESFQNWQSEFLSTAVLIVLSIFLREKGSPESKPVNASDDETGS